MNTRISSGSAAVLRTVCALLLLSGWLSGAERFRIELYGGISAVDPKDFNLLSKAEMQYNGIYFIERLSYYQGYFINEFPEIRELIPVGLRLRYVISEKFSFSLGLERFSREKEQTIQGTFGYSANASESHTKRYDPYRLSVSGYSVLGGAHYRLPVGNRTDIEAGAAAGWSRAEVGFSSQWSYTASYQEPSISYLGIDGGLLEEDGSGGGFTAQAFLRLNRMLGRRIGLFVEGAYTYCRMTSIEGSGRETRMGLSGETTWTGIWGIKKEEIHVRWGSDSVLVPTNYWGAWTESQRERDFVLDLSGFRLVLGIAFRL